MKNYAIISINADNKEILESIQNSLLERRLVASSELTTSEVTYWDEGGKVSRVEYNLDMRTRKKLCDGICDLIMSEFYEKSLEITWFTCKGDKKLCSSIKQFTTSPSKKCGEKVEKDK
jgi:uncharacterized protein involved in tolerance to divalent cations